ncbi:THAP-type domain-containing protein, partial [Aphis craccivora]
MIFYNNSSHSLLEALSPQKLRKRYICSHHFDASMYMNSNASNSRLIQDAVPTKYSIVPGDQ